MTMWSPELIARAKREEQERKDREVQAAHERFVTWRRNHGSK